VESGHEWPYGQDASQGYSASPTLTPHAPAQHADDEQTTADEDDGGYSSNRESHSSADGKVRKVKRKGFSRSLRSMSRRGHGQVRALARVHKLNEMGEIVDKKGHRAWDMACALQLGIRVHVSMNNHVRGEPGFDTFRETVKLKFPPAGGALTPPHQGSSFKFKDYAPSIFSRLREARQPFLHPRNGGSPSRLSHFSRRVPWPPPPVRATSPSPPRPSHAAGRTLSSAMYKRDRHF